MFLAAAGLIGWHFFLDRRGEVLKNNGGPICACIRIWAKLSARSAPLWLETSGNLDENTAGACIRCADERDHHAFFCAGTGSKSSSFDQFWLL